MSSEQEWRNPVVKEQFDRDVAAYHELTTALEQCDDESAYAAQMRARQILLRDSLINVARNHAFEIPEALFSASRKQ